MYNHDHVCFISPRGDIVTESPFLWLCVRKFPSRFGLEQLGLYYCSTSLAVPFVMRQVMLLIR